MKNTDDKCFYYAVTVALNYQRIKWDLERASNIKPFINKYNWEGTNYPSKIDNVKTFRKNNPTISLNILYSKEKEICPAYISKIDSNCKRQIILLMFPNEEKEGPEAKSKGRWHYLALKRLSTLLRGITSKHHSDFYCLNCLHSFKTESKLKFHEKVFKSKDLFGIVIPSKKDKILEFN